MMGAGEIISPGARARRRDGRTSGMWDEWFERDDDEGNEGCVRERIDAETDDAQPYRARRRPATDEHVRKVYVED